MDYCDTVVLLRHGRVVAAGVPGAVLTPDRLADVFGVRGAITTHPLTGRPHQSALSTDGDGNADMQIAIVVYPGFTALDVLGLSMM